MVIIKEKYLFKIRPFYDSDIVKVITGIRRAGKSSILKSIIDELITRGLSNRIIYLPLDKRGYKDIITPEQLEKKHREILDDVENKFATLNSVKDLKEQMGDMKEKIDRIYECIIAVK